MPTISKEVTTTEEVDIDLEVSEVADMYNEMSSEDQEEFRDSTELKESSGSDEEITEEQCINYIENNSDNDFSERIISAMAFNDDDLNYALDNYIDCDDDDVKKVIAKYFHITEPDGSAIEAVRKKDDDSALELDVVIEYISDNRDAESVQRYIKAMLMDAADLKYAINKFADDNNDHDLREAACKKFNLQIPSEAPCNPMPKRQEETGSEVDRKYQRVFATLRDKFTVEQLEMMSKISF